MAAAGLKPTIIAVVSSAVAFASLVGFGGTYLWQPLAAAQETQAAAQTTHAELEAKMKQLTLCLLITLGLLLAPPAQAQTTSASLRVTATVLPRPTATAKGTPPGLVAARSTDADFPLTEWLTPGGQRAVLVSVPQWREIYTAMTTTLPQTQQALSECVDWEKGARDADRIRASRGADEFVLPVALGVLTGAVLGALLASFL